MLGITEEQESYVARFGEIERAEGGKSPAWLQAMRKAAISHFTEIGFPTTHQEQWRFTNVAPIAATTFKAAGAYRPGRVDAPAIAPFLFGETASAEIVFVDGRYAPDLSNVSNLPEGVGLSSLADALAHEPQAVEPLLGSRADYKTHPFVALNTAFIADGAFVRISDGAALAKPIHIVYVTSAEAGRIVTHPRNLLVAGGNVQGTIIESYVGLGKDAYFTNPVTEAIIGENSTIEMIKLEHEGHGAYHVAAFYSHQSRSSTLRSHTISLGAKLARNEITGVLGAEGCEGTFNGLYLATGERLVDNHTVIDHAKPHCNSRELFKGILDDRARSIFNGRIIVRKDAQKTDSKQTNRNLLLSEDATVYTNPQLEIYADDVKCTHGATIGQLDEEALFYMRSRGLAREPAERLLIYAFASEIIDRIGFETARVRLERALFRGLAGNESLETPV